MPKRMISDNKEDSIGNNSDNSPLISPRKDNMKEIKTSLAAKYLKVVGAVALYWSVSICMVFLNKYLLKSESLNLNAPLFVTWFQCVVTVVLSIVCDFISRSNPNLVTFPSTKFDIKLSREAMKLSFVFVGMITFNNLCLREVGVAFYTVSRSLVTIFSLVFTYFILNKTTTMRAIACCSIVLGGFLLGVKQEALGDMSIIGVVYGVIASALVALNAIYIKKVLPAMGDSVLKMAYYNNINACVIFLPMIFIWELTELMTFDKLFSGYFWASMTVAGLMGFCMGYVAGLQIKITGPVTHTISGVAKACFQTVIAVMWNQEIKTSLWWFANLMVLGGTCSYSLVKSYDMKKQHQNETTNSIKERA